MKRKSRPTFNKKFGLSGYIILCVALVAAAIIATYLITIGGFESKEAFNNAKKYLEIESAIENNYIGDVSSDDIREGAASAMVRTLGDKWSYYMTPSEYEAYKLSDANEYAGIGITIQMDAGKFKITSVQEGTPAAEAGIEPGQYLVSVDGQDVKDMNLSEVSTLVRSKLNTDFKIGLEDKKGNESSVTLACTTIYKTAVSSKLINDNIGYIRIANFEAGSSDDTISAIESLLSIGATRFIFDLRDNPGGLLSELMNLLDYILPEGDIFVSIDKAGNETVTKSDNVCLKYNMCVIVNENTYSAAEFFAAAIQEYDWGSVVGMQTTGKARSQITVELSDGSAIHISTHKYLTPNRVDLADAGGVIPDYTISNEVKVEHKPKKTDDSENKSDNDSGEDKEDKDNDEDDEDDEPKVVDPQLDKAIEVLG